MIQVNPIILPSWIGNKAVFQQNVPFVIEGKAAPSATITLEISKDPTDGRKVHTRLRLILIHLFSNAFRMLSALTISAAAMSGCFWVMISCAFP